MKWLAVLTVFLAPMAHGAGFELSPDGASVIDTRARLAWARCVEGMVWSGSHCVGTPLLLDLNEAQAHVVARWKAEGVRWRLPTAPELQRLVDRQARPPGVDASLFPAGPPEWHWSATSTVNSGAVNLYRYDNVMQGRSGDNVNRLNYLHGWAVHMSSGEATGQVSRSSRLPIRLVRPAP